MFVRTIFMPLKPFLIFNEEKMKGAGAANGEQAFLRTFFFFFYFLLEAQVTLLPVA